MEIIKAGDLSHLKKPKTFECIRCGCIFNAYNTEYQYSGMQYNEAYYKCEYPTCECMVYTT
jgi:hypothetical protein